MLETIETYVPRTGGHDEARSEHRCDCRGCKKTAVLVLGTPRKHFRRGFALCVEHARSMKNLLYSRREH
jgi:hypothetical protein